MEIKKIYHKGILTHEYFVNESDTNEIVEKMGLDKSLNDKLSDYLKNNECLIIKRGNDYTLMSNGREYFGIEISELINDEDVPDAKPYDSKARIPISYRGGMKALK